MTLDKFIEGLLKLQSEGYGSKQVYYTVGSSGECGRLSSGHVTDEQGECGPYDLPKGETEYISIYAGN